MDRIACLVTPALLVSSLLRHFIIFKSIFSNVVFDYEFVTTQLTSEIRSE